MLAQSIANRHGDRVRFVEENFGESALAERFGIAHYPAIFVDEALVAGPWDFFEWPDTPPGRYVPFRDAASRARFESDLESFVERRLRGETLDSATRAPAGDSLQVQALPRFEVATLGGETISDDSIRGRAVIVEFWATWCPPCRSTLAFLGELERKHRDSLAVLPIAVSSKEDEVRALLKETEDAPSSSVMGSDELVASFGGVLAVPTLMIFSPAGEALDVFYGAPPDLHERVAERLSNLGIETEQDD